MIFNRFLKKYSHSEKFLLILFSFLLAIFFHINLLKNLNAIPGHDMSLGLSYIFSAYRSVVNFFEFPVWSPYYGGGSPLLFHPDSFILSPIYYLIYLNPFFGLKFAVIFSYILGYNGFYKLSGLFFTSKIEKHISSLTFVFCGFHLMKLATGMMWYLTAMLLPWYFYYLFLYVSNKETDYKHLVKMAFCLLFILLGGGSYYFIFSVFSTIIISLLYFREFMQHKKIKSFLIFIILSVFLCSLKIIPSYFIMKEFISREVSFSHGGFSNPLSFFIATTSFNMNLNDIGSLGRFFAYGVDENSLFIGLSGLILFFTGIYYSLIKKTDIKLIIKKSVFTFFLIFGFYLAFSEMLSNQYSFGAILNNVFKIHLNNMRVPQRFLVITLIFMSILVGFGLKFIDLKFPNKKHLKYIIFLTHCTFMFIYSYKSTNRIYSVAPDINKQLSFRHDNYGSLENYLKNLANGIASSEGTPSMGYGFTVYSMHDKDYPGEFFFLNSTVDNISVLSWTPSSFTLKFNNPLEDNISTLIINQYFANGWKLIDSFGHNINPSIYWRKINKKNERLLSFDLEKQTTQVYVFYDPPGWKFGIALFLIGCFLSIYLFFKKSYNKLLV